jgi:hypothetical protein
MFAGCSGCGKTTLAKWIGDEYEMGFYSGSMSDLIESTKEIPHSDMLGRDKDILYKEDYQLLNLRNKLFKNRYCFVTDRSYLDSAAYFIYKQSKSIPSCEIEQFLGNCSALIANQCDLLVFIDFVPDLVNKWVTEDNNKRITNNYFQIQISSLMNATLRLMGYETLYQMDHVKKKVTGNILKRLLGNHIEYLRYGDEFGRIRSIYGNTDVLIIREPNLELRKHLLRSIL